MNPAKDNDLRRLRLTIRLSGFRAQVHFEDHAYPANIFAFIYVCDLFGRGLIFYDCGNG